MALMMALWSGKDTQAQVFGKNKVKYKDFEWYSITTEHFRILYYEGGLEGAQIAARILEDSHDKIAEAWDYPHKGRIPIILYNAHNDFEQTNVITEPIGEGTGGFTELFKNRIVIPYDGSLSKFRHVLHHELVHAMMFSLLYGGPMESILGREFMFQVPLWFAEGLAEHESQYWGTEADMYIRDAMINEYMPQMLNSSIGVYKGGEALLKYMEETYDRPDRKAIAAILKNVARTKNLEASLRSVTGKGIEDILKDWFREMRIQHWPEVADREDPEDFSNKLTDHVSTKSYINRDPAFSPQGDKIAFLTDRSGYKDILLMYSVDGKIERKLIRGEKSGAYEEMHWLRGGITFSPDGKSIAFSAKAGPGDVIHIKAFKSGGMDKTIRLNFDGIFSPDWSPDGTELVIVALKDGRSDLYRVDVQTEKVTRLTNDLFDYMDPKWSRDGEWIAFASDRGDGRPVDWSQITESYDIFIMKKSGTPLRRITTNPYDDRDPTWSPNSRYIAFSSDRNGIYNLYVADLDSSGVFPITNVMSGAFEPCWSPNPDDDKLAFTSFQNGGWDIFVVKRPIKRHDEMPTLVNTVYRQQIITQDSLMALEPDSIQVAEDSRGEEGLENFTPERYELEFSTDFFTGYAQYNSFIGIGGMGLLSVSDILGNHRITIGTNLYYSLEDSDFDFLYYYLKRRTDIGLRIFHYKTYYRTSSRYDIFSDRTYGGGIVLRRPFTKFTRIDAGIFHVTEKRELMTWGRGNVEYSPVRALTTSLSLVNDTILWGFTGPLNGRRSNFTIEYSPDVDFSNLAYTTYTFDVRNYKGVGKKYVFVFRLTGGLSTGKDPRFFFLGGTDNWINAHIGRLPDDMEAGNDLYHARFIMPLRGYKYFDSGEDYQLWGHKFALMNLEFRFPFIEYVKLGWPIPVPLANIGGILFIDAGSVWDDTFRGIETQETRMPRLKDIKASFGTGFRVYLGSLGFLLKWDVAWRTDLSNVKKPDHLISIGAEF